MIRLHEIIKIVTDLQARGELALARYVAGQYMDRLDNGELRVNYLALSARLGFMDQVMDLLEEYLETERWFSTCFLGRIPELRAMEDLPRYRNILRESKAKEAEYQESEAAQPIIQVPPAGRPPYPLLVAMHGNCFSPGHSASNWKVAAEAGWLVFHPVAKRLVGYGFHWWDTLEESRILSEEQAGQDLRGYEIDPERVLLGGFSKGGEVSMVLALLGWKGAKGFLTIGAGGYYHMDPEQWRPLLASPPTGLRGVAMYSPYDLERSEAESQTWGMFRAAGIEVRLEKYTAEGHVFPEDFAGRFEEAGRFLLEPRMHANER